jgi:RNA-directed DNA polymerase
LKIKETIRKGYGWSGSSLISALNPIIKGWANHYRTVASKATFAAVDNYIYQKTFYWTMRKFNGHNRYQAMKRTLSGTKLARKSTFVFTK